MFVLGHPNNKVIFFEYLFVWEEEDANGAFLISQNTQRPIVLDDGTLI